MLLAMWKNFTIYCLLGAMSRPYKLLTSKLWCNSCREGWRGRGWGGGGGGGKILEVLTAAMHVAWSSVKF